MLEGCLWSTVKAVTVVNTKSTKFLHMWGIFLSVPQDLCSCGPCMTMNVHGADLTAAGAKTGASG